MLDALSQVIACITSIYSPKYKAQDIEGKEHRRREGDKNKHLSADLFLLYCSTSSNQLSGYWKVLINQIIPHDTNIRFTRHIKQI